jgi:hypothetical protein
MIYTIKDCSCGNRCEGRTDKCATCNRLERRASKVQASDNNSPINKRSEKTAKIESRYLTRLRTWKRGKKCAATFPHDCSNEIQCHHMASRGTHFYDEYAEEREIPLTLDERFWMPLCPVAHDYVTEHSKWACENGYSFKRITDPVFRRK